ncbi:MAG: alpha/beta hydrolase, partial [Phycisphaerales bacterium]
ILTGALGTAESVWMTISHFADDAAERYRVIAPTYPADIASMAELVDGIAGLLKGLHIERASVLGGSAGGYVAQVFVRRHRELVEKLIIAFAGPPKPERGRKIARAMWWLRLMPMGILRVVARKRLGGLLPAGHPELRFIRAYLDEALRYHMTKEGFLNLCRRGADADLNYRFGPDDLAGWPGEVLLMMADDDPSTPEPVGEALLALYPGAQIHLFHGGGHAAAILKRDEYLGVMEQFLAGSSPEACAGATARRE